MNEKKYRLAPQANSWNIEELRVSGKETKTPGAENWVAFKFPGTLENAALSLRELVTRDVAATTELDTAAIIAAVKESTCIVCAAVAEASE